ncbi:hypothetical protein [Chryseobacterium aquaticum]|uniref:RES domain-containing protein n=2 Tax=Chryseobacterium TaxID=59732 RepID=A0A101CHC0_9FLAO|nr:hypothetical protein [Chryseobacterium aquaticum]KUJ56224.1 hypothetical protein AR686_06520 [Chryseobacterium aquaticum subsp. greenlandense]
MPNWNSKFRDLPEIPSTKKFVDGSQMTEEQIIGFKLLNEQDVTEDELKKFVKLENFYSELREKLRDLDYKNFTENEVDEFKNYIFYAFNYRIFASNNIAIFSTYRLVVNENVMGSNEAIVDTKFLSYPPIDIVKKIGKFNRANSSNCTLFYSCENINTSLKEIKPPINKLITVGVWVPKNRNKFNGYAISNSERAGAVNAGVKKSNDAFTSTKDELHSQFFKFAKNYLDLIGEEFTKEVNHHNEYIISALFAESTLYDLNYQRKEGDFECVIYPSVGNNFFSDNVAFIPEVIDNDFILEKAIEFEIEEQYYDREYTTTHPENITLAKIKNLRISKRIIGNIIEWE